MSEEKSEERKSIDSWFDYYDYAGFIAPGAALLLGLLYFFHDTIPRDYSKDFFKESSLGTLGLVILIAYVLGQILEGIANILEPPIWWLWGRPHTWIRSYKSHKYPWTFKKKTRQLLTEEQREQLLKSVRQRFNLLPKPKTFDALKTTAECDALIRQIRAAVAANVRSRIIDRQNANYALARGLATAILIVFCVAAFKFWKFAEWRSIDTLLVVFVFIVAYVAALTRMCKSHVWHARELYAAFIIMNLPTTAEPTTSAHPLSNNNSPS